MNPMYGLAYRFTALLLLLSTFNFAFAQCDASRFGRALVSDRYVDAQLAGEVLVLANGHGLVFSRLNGASADVLAVEAIPGQTTGVYLDGNTLFVTSKGTGLFTYRFNEPGQPATREGFTAIDAITTAASFGQVLYVGREQRLEAYDLSRGLPYRLMDTVEMSGTIRKIRSDGQFVAVQFTDGKMEVVAFDQMFQVPIVLNVQGHNAFYNFEITERHIVVDAPDGIRWVAINEDGSIGGSNFLIENRGANIVLGMALAGDLLYARFATDFVVYRLIGGQQANRVSSREIDLSEIRIPKMFAFGEELLLLNQSKSRPWSLAWYQLRGSNLQQNALIASRLDEITGVTTIGNWVFVAADRYLYYQSLDNGAELGPIDAMTQFNIGESVVELVSDQAQLILTTSQAGNNAVSLRRIDFENGNLVERSSDSYIGSIRDLRHRNGRISFVQSFRDAIEDHYIAHVSASDLESDVMLTRDIPIGGPNPFQYFQTLNDRLAYYDGSQIVIHSIHSIEQMQIVQLGADPPPIKSFAFLGDLGLIETESGILELALSGTSQSLAEYDSWYDLTLSKSNHLFVQNRVYQVPGQFFLLDREEDGILSAQLDLLTSSSPKYLSFGESGLLAADDNSVDEYELLCPPLAYTYVIPYRDTYELDINTFLAANTVVQLVAYDTANQVVGRQLMDRDILGKLNRKRFADWFVDVNVKVTPDTFVLHSSQPLTPVVSGSIGGVNGRFAYTVSPNTGSGLIFPHIANPAQGWTSEMHLRNTSQLSTTDVIILEPSGRTRLLAMTPGSTRVAELSSTLESETRWISLLNQQLDTVIDGFARYRRADIDDLAVIPMIKEASEFLVIPHVIGQPETYWTGLALTNPNARPVRLRIIGYDQAGLIALDHDLSIEALGQFVVQLEDWLLELDREDVRWLTVVAELPIVGIEMFGSHDKKQLAGTSLSANSGTSLIYPGVRESEHESTEIVITNRDSRAEALTVEAYSSSGRRIAQSVIQIQSKERRSLKVSDLFGQLATIQLPDVHTILVSGNLDITGLVLWRGVQSEWLSVHSPYAITD